MAGILMEVLVGALSAVLATLLLAAAQRAGRALRA